MISPFRLAAVLLALSAAPVLAQAPTPTQRPAPGAPVVPAPSAAAPAPAKTPVLNTTPSPAAAGGKVDINAASEQQLDALPGVGPARAKAIVAGRPYSDLDELVKKNVLSQSVFDGAKSRMALANINTASAADLARTLPGIGDVRSRAIVAGRPYRTTDDLVRKNILTKDAYDKIKDLVVF